MPILLCSVCDRIFDVSVEVEAQYDPAICEDCLNDQQEQLQETWNQLDQDESAIKEMTNGHD